MQASIGSERSSQLIGSLHAILKPFLLRRLKADVEHSLPPKKEYVLYAPLSLQQREAYNQVVEGTLRSYLIGKGDDKLDVTEADAGVKVDNGKRQLRKKGRKSYAVDGDDDEYFDMLENGEVDERGVKEKAQKTAIRELAKQHRLKATCELFLVFHECNVQLWDVPLYSEASEQYEASKHGYAAAQSVLASIPVRLAVRSGDTPTCSQ